MTKMKNLKRKRIRPEKKVERLTCLFQDLRRSYKIANTSQKENPGIIMSLRDPNHKPLSLIILGPR